jgi:hypothetical protein
MPDAVIYGYPAAYSMLALINLAGDLQVRRHLRMASPDWRAIVRIERMGLVTASLLLVVSLAFILHVSGTGTWVVSRIADIFPRITDRIITMLEFAVVWAISSLGGGIFYDYMKRRWNTLRVPSAEQPNASAASSRRRRFQPAPPRKKRRR